MIDLGAPATAGPPRPTSRAAPYPIYALTMDGPEAYGETRFVPRDGQVFAAI